MSDHVLQVGDELPHNGIVHRVIKVSECNAIIVPASVEPVTLTDRKGKSHTFTPTGRAIQIATETAQSIITKFAGTKA